MQNSTAAPVCKCCTTAALYTLRIKVRLRKGVYQPSAVADTCIGVSEARKMTCLVSTFQKGLAPVLCSCRHTEQYPEMQIYDDCVVINDAFPKARCHALVIARQEGLEGPAGLRPEHLPLLRSMQVALQIICPIQKKGLLHIALLRVTLGRAGTFSLC